MWACSTWLDSWLCVSGASRGLAERQSSLASPDCHRPLPGADPAWSARDHPEDGEKWKKQIIPNILKNKIKKKEKEKKKYFVCVFISVLPEDWPGRLSSSAGHVDRCGSGYSDERRTRIHRAGQEGPASRKIYTHTARTHWAVQTGTWTHKHTVSSVYYIEF